MFSFESYEAAAEQTSGSDLLNAADLQRLRAPATPGAQAPNQPAPGDGGSQPLQFGNGFTPLPQRDGSGPIGVNTESEFSPGYIPGVSDLPPDAHPQNGWKGSALATPAPAERAGSDGATNRAGGVQPVQDGSQFTPPYTTPPKPAYGPPDLSKPQSDYPSRLLNSEWLERALSGASSIYLGAKLIPEINSQFAGMSWPGVKQLTAVNKDSWLAAARTPLGKAIGYSWAADTALDYTFLSDYGTSWKTLVVDVGTPFIAKTLLGRFSLPATVAMSVGAHALEKFWLEKSSSR